MNATTRAMAGWNAALAGVPRVADGDRLLSVVDAGICGIIFVAPYVFGGRHDFGRLILVSLIALTASAWYLRRALRGAKCTPSRGGYGLPTALCVLAIGLLTLQVVPLPPAVMEILSPATCELLPTWTGDGSMADFGSWQTLSLAPHESMKSLAMLVSYALFFLVLLGRIRDTDDIELLFKWISAAAIAMATIGLLQQATSDGKFFWIYAHPQRSATSTLCGPFINRNHFAHFLALGIGPLVAWMMLAHDRMQKAAAEATPARVLPLADRVSFWIPAGGLAVTTFTLLLTRSRGAAVATLVGGTVLISIFALKRVVGGRFALGLVALGAVVVGLLSVYGYDEVVQRLDDFTEGSLDEVDASGTRRKIWAGNIAAFNAFPWTGAGAGSHRELLPVYMAGSAIKEYTHAENGYLQIAAENGLGGVLLLGATFFVLGCCCWTCLRQQKRVEEAYLLGAIAAGLAISAAHSVVDFVWYMPACMSLTVVLIACLLRLTSEVNEQFKPEAVSGSRRAMWRWLRTLGVAVAGVWTVHVYVGPGVAAVHWDRYLRASVVESQLRNQEMSEVAITSQLPAGKNHEQLNDQTLHHLEQVVKWDPQCARAHCRLAAKYLVKFELLQRDAANPMGLAQIRGACLASSFASVEELSKWLERAVGTNVQWLRRAISESREAVALCPLQGEAYVYLAQLSFLGGGSVATSQAYVDQALSVRPHDPEVMFEIGKQELLSGELYNALVRWQACFGTSGPHQLKIVYLVAGRVPAQLLIEMLQPDWRTLRPIWERYRQFGSPEDLEQLLSYSMNATSRDTQEGQTRRAGFIWYSQAKLFADMNRPDHAIVCLQNAYLCNSRHYSIRRAYALALQQVGRLAEAETHLRWCLARRPTDRELNNSLISIAKIRVAQRKSVIVSPVTRPPATRSR